MLIKQSCLTNVAHRGRSLISTIALLTLYKVFTNTFSYYINTWQPAGYFAFVMLLGRWKSRHVTGCSRYLLHTEYIIHLREAQLLWNLDRASLCIITSPARAAAKYCNKRVCVCVCLSVCPRAYLPEQTRNLYQLFVHVAYRRGSVLLRRGDEIPSGRGDFVGFLPHWQCIVQHRFWDKFYPKTTEQTEMPLELMDWAGLGTMC